MGIDFDLDYCEGKYIYFKKADVHNPKTWIVEVYAKDGDILLGKIKWYAQWRQYAFYPEEGTVFEKTCMNDISELTRRLGVIQRAGIKPQLTLHGRSQNG